MEQGNAVITAPEQVAGQPDQAANIGEDGQPVQKPNLEVELAKLSERYSASSTEGKRLADENKQLMARLTALEQRSLTKPENTDVGYPSEDSYVKFALENDKTEKEARLEYKKDLIQHQNLLAIKAQNEAILNRLKYESQLQERAYTENSPDAKEAIEAFKNIPALNALSTVEKVEYFKTLKTNLIPKADGRDLSQVKMAASGSSNTGSGRGMETSNPKFDQIAKDAGYPNYKVMLEFRNASTAEEHASLKKKYNIKKF